MFDAYTPALGSLIVAGVKPKPRRWPTPGALAQALDPATKQTPALRLIDDELVKVADGTSRRLMVFMPPQEGKSQRVSRRFPTWLLEQDPTLRIGIVSLRAPMPSRQVGALLMLPPATPHHAPALSGPHASGPAGTPSEPR